MLTFHLSLWVDGPLIYPKFPVIMEHLSRGVQLFFVLSAFTLFQTARMRWKASNYPMLAFYIRRAFRILPLWWIAIAIEYANRPDTDIKSAVGSAFFVFGLKPEWLSMLTISVGWSLFVEESFYIFFPFWRRFLNSWIPVAILLVITAFGAQYILRNGFFELNSFHDHDFLAKSPLTNYYAFFLGILLERLRPSKIFGWFYSDKALARALLNIATSICLILLFVFGRIIGTFVLVPLFIASFNPKAIFGVLMRTRFMMATGRCCYSIYLFHGVVGPYITTKAHEYLWPTLNLFYLPIEVKTLLLLPPVAAACLTVGLLSYYLIEIPCINLGKHLVTKLGVPRKA